jgi:CheY-like chemotaxis protein
MLSKIIRFMAVIIILFSLLCGYLSTQEEPAFYLKEGIELYKRGKIQEAYETLETALKQAKELDPDIIRFFVFELEKDVLVEMLAKGGKLAKTAKRILELSKAALEQYRASPKELEKLIEILKDEKAPFDKKHIAINRLILIGKNAIPALVKGLGDEKNETFRTNCIITLTKFGDVAVIPLIAALKTNNLLQKRNIIIVLINISNKLASPYLAKIMRDKNEDEGIRSLIRKAFKKWFPSSKTPTKTLFTKYAYYILKAPGKLERELEDLGSFWYFEGEELKFMPVLSFETKFLIAEQYLLEALHLQRNFRPALLTLVLTYTKYYLQVLGFLKGTKEESQRRELKKVLEKTKKRFESVSSIPPSILYEALARAKKNKEFDVAEEIIKILAVADTFQNAYENYKKGNIFTWEFFKSLISPDKPIRYSTALTILKWNPDKEFPNIDKWHKVADELLSEESIWRILLLDKDQVFYNKLKNISKTIKLSITQTNDPKKALFLARSFPAFDLIIVGFEHIDDIVYSVELAGIDEKGERKKVDIYLLKAFSEDIRLKNTPVIVAISNEEERGKINETIFSIGRDGDIKEVILKKARSEELLATLQSVFEQFGLFSESKNKANSLVIEFEKALQQLDIKETSLNWKYLVNQLIKNAEFKTREISLEAIKALGNLTDEKSVSALVRIARDTQNKYSFEHKKEALLSLINVLTKFPNSLTEVDVELLFEIIKSGHPKLRELVSKVIGKANLKPSVRVKLIEELKK